MDETQSNPVPVDESNRFHVEPGMRFHKWTAVSHASGSNSKSLWVCECECGTTRAVIVRDLFAGKSKSCGCIKGDSCRKDMAGQRFGTLVVVALSEKGKQGTPAKWRCICDCGREAFPTGRNLRNGNTTSCGDGIAHRRSQRVTERIASGVKTCCRCKETKSLHEFYKKRTRDGYGSHCKKCSVLKNKERWALRLASDKQKSDNWRRNNADRVRYKSRKWYADNAEFIQEKRRCSPSFRQAKCRDNVRGKQRFARRAKQMWKGVELRCRQLGLEFDLTPEFIEQRLRAGCCEATGLPFDFVTTRGPFSPSLDRVIAGGGYTTDNVQIVAWCYNAAKGSWDKTDVLRMAKALLRMEKRRHGRSSTDPPEERKESRRRQGRLEFVA